MVDFEKTWQCLQFLAGAWAAETAGQPGPGRGGFTFTSDLEGRLLTRRSSTRYPATENREAYTHEDVTFVYRDPASDSVRADYVDNEDHVIHYRVRVSEDCGTITFESEFSPSAPAFRLTFGRLGEDEVDVDFAIGAPGQPPISYVSGPVRRVGR